jgi:hypothetical protein
MCLKEFTKHPRTAGVDENWRPRRASRHVIAVMVADVRRLRFPKNVRAREGRRYARPSARPLMILFMFCFLCGAQAIEHRPNIAATRERQRELAHTCKKFQAGTERPRAASGRCARAAAVRAAARAPVAALETLHLDLRARRQLRRRLGLGSVFLQLRQLQLELLEDRAASGDLPNCSVRQLGDRVLS